MRKAGVAHSKSSKDMESHVFLKAKTRVRPGGRSTRQSGSGGGIAADPVSPSALGVGTCGCSLMIAGTVSFAGSTLGLPCMSIVQAQGGYWVDCQDAGRAFGPRPHCQCPPFVVSSRESCRPRLLLQEGEVL